MLPTHNIIYIMKNLVYLLLLLVFFSCNSNLETKTTQASDIEQKSASAESTSKEVNQKTTDSQTTELKTVEDIRAEFQSIMTKIQKGQIDSTSFYYTCYEESGRLVYFLEDGQLRMIRYSQGWEHGGVTKEYFLKDNKPFFIFNTTLAWSFDSESSVQDATKDDITESRFYIIDNKLIKCLEKEFTIKSSVKNNPTSATVPNKEVACTDLTEILKDYELAVKYKNQTTDIECLE